MFLETVFFIWLLRIQSSCDSYSYGICHKITISFIFYVLSTTCPANIISLWNLVRVYKISNIQEPSQF